VTGPPIAPVREEHGVKVSIKTEAPKPVTRDPSNPSPSAASTTSARKPARPARTKPPVAASAAPQKAEKKRENPLLIEIQ
jgi:hypothetical protein